MRLLHQLPALIAASLVALGAGCGTERPAFEADTLVPSQVMQGATTPAEIQGSFFNDLRAQLGDDPHRIERVWEVRFESEGSIPFDAGEVVREDASTLRLAIPSGLSGGTYTVWVVAPSGVEVALEDPLVVQDEVVIDPGALSIETAPDGTGTVVDERSLGIGETIELFAIEREEGVFVDNVQVDWSTMVGTLDAGPSASTLYEATTPGQTRITARHPELGEAQTGLFTIAGIEGVLEGRLAAPDLARVGEEFVVQLQVGNAGDERVTNVQPCDFFSEPAAESSLLVTPAFGLDPTETASFEWTVSASAPGPMRITMCATGQLPAGDVLSTGTLMAEVQIEGVAASEVELLAADPFGDGSPHAYVVSFDGDLHVGPSRDGASLLRLSPDGMSRLITFEIAEDNMSIHRMENASGGPYVSFGSEGCRSNSPACGPDNEDARGLLRTLVLDGRQWLVYGAGFTDNEVDYYYMSRDTGDVRQFWFVDAVLSTGRRTSAVTSLFAFRDRTYVGYSDNSGGRPFLVQVDVVADAPGVEVVGDARNMDLDNVAALAEPPVAMVDAMWGYADHMHAANAGGWVRASALEPLPDDWTVVTPDRSEYAALNSLETDKRSAIDPADRAVPQTTVYRGRLFVARNTTAGPQIFACDAAANGGPCDTDDWQFIAASAGNANLSSFDNDSNKTIGLLTSVDTALYVGFNNVDGIQVYRSTADFPQTRADFTGRDGCSAAEPGCEGLGGAGFGDSSRNQQIFDGRNIRFGPEEAVYLTVGNGTDAVRLYRIP